VSGQVNRKSLQALQHAAQKMSRKHGEGLAPPWAKGSWVLTFSSLREQDPAEYIRMYLSSPKLIKQSLVLLFNI
jgi:hypothetical protein